jgi:hypothetical protein
MWFLSSNKRMTTISSRRRFQIYVIWGFEIGSHCSIGVFAVRGNHTLVNRYIPPSRVVSLLPLQDNKRSSFASIRKLSDCRCSDVIFSSNKIISTVDLVAQGKRQTKRDLYAHVNSTGNSMFERIEKRTCQMRATVDAKLLLAVGPGWLIGYQRG